MKGLLLHFLDSEQLDDSLLLGFYGGGNYGDELLLEVLAGILKKRGTSGVSIAYQHPELYRKFHHDFGFDRVNLRSKRALFRAILSKKHIIVGGGGLWGMDVNFNILLMSLMLLFARRILGKNVYLLAVGYYNSAPLMGRVSAWLAAKAANTIVARDDETYENFTRINKDTRLDIDIAWYIDELDLGDYDSDLDELEDGLHVSGKTLFMTLRRFRGQEGERLGALIELCLHDNTDKQIIIALMEPRHVDPAGYRRLRAWQRQHQNVQIIDFGGNPLALFLFFKKYHEQLIFIGPQFHGILSAHLNGVPFLPLAYDNKVSNLLHTIAPDVTPIRLNTLSLWDLQQFIDQSYTSKETAATIAHAL